jgi:protein-disulfide isomerase
MDDSENKPHFSHEPEKVQPRVEPRTEPRRPQTYSQPTKPEPEQSGQKWLLVAAVVQVILLLYVAVQIGGGGATIQGAAVVDVGGELAPTPSAPPAAAPTVNMEALMDDDAVKGDPNAPVTIIEFSDFECPFCSRFYSQTLSQIDEKYIKTGKVKLVFRDFPLSFHPQAQKAAEAAECAGEQGKYYEMHDALFEKGVTGGVDSFKMFAKELKLDSAKFDKCLDSGEQAAEVRKDFNDGGRAGVQGTPGFFVNGKSVSGAQPFSVFEQLIEAELSG